MSTTPAGSNLAFLDATAQAQLVRRREVTPKELVEAAIDRIEKLNPSLNAVIHRLYDKARSQACSSSLPDGPFTGVPFLVKDVVCHTAGDPYHCGMRFLRDRDWHEDSDTVQASRLRKAGFIFVGKTNTPELAFSPTTEPLAYGATRNPWNPALSPSGSSGGSAAAVASGMVAVAHGNDMGGSIRTPASACGLVGLKPTRGRNSLGPDLGEFWWQTTHEHVLTRSVRDTAAVLDATSGPASGDPYFAAPPLRPFLQEVGADPGRLRIGLTTTRPGARGEAHADCREAVLSVARMLEDLDHRVEESAPPLLALPDDGSITIVFAVSIARELERWSKRCGRTIEEQDVEPTTWLAAEMGRGVSASLYVEAGENLHHYGRRMASWWDAGFDLLLTPTLGDPPWPIGPLGPGGGDPLEVLTRWTHVSPFCTPFNVSGQPAISLPLHWNHDGLPVGVQLVAADGREDLLLRVAAQLEEAFPWKDKRPPIHA